MYSAGGLLWIKMNKQSNKTKFIVLCSPFSGLNAVPIQFLKEDIRRQAEFPQELEGRQIRKGHLRGLSSAVYILFISSSWIY